MGNTKIQSSCYHPPSCRGATPSCKVCSFFVCWPLSPLSLGKVIQTTLSLLFDFAIRPPWEFRRVAPDGTPNGLIKPKNQKQKK